jgi:hypothetical protein
MDVSKASHYIYCKNVKSPNLYLKQGISYLKREGGGGKERETERKREIKRNRQRQRKRERKEGES